MGKNYYSSTEAALAAGAANLIAVVTPAAATYGLTAGGIAAYTLLANNFSTLLAIATAASTRTSVSVENKNAAKRLLKTATVNIARTISSVSTVTNAQLLALGLNERVVPAPRGVPSAAPVLEVVSVAGRLAKVRVHSGSTETRGKPFGAIGANIYSFVGNASPEDPRAFHFEGMATRRITDILFSNSVPSGATVWLSAQWVSARGHLSVGSVPISFALQGGAIPAAA